MRRIAPPVDPRQIPEHTLWTLAKDTRRAEARTRMVPLLLKPELRFYVSRDGEMHLLWSQVMEDGRAVSDLAEQKRSEFEAMGWVLTLSATEPR